MDVLEIIAGILGGPMGCGTAYPETGDEKCVRDEDPSLSESLHPQSFNRYDMAGGDGWPAQVFYVEKNLISQVEEGRLVRYATRQIQGCGNAIHQASGLAIPDGPEHFTYIVSDHLSAPGLSPGLSAAYSTRGEKIFRVSGLNLAWKKSDPPSQCVDKAIAHELAHHFDGTSPLQHLKQSYLLKEGLAEYLSNPHVHPIPPDQVFDFPLDLDSLGPQGEPFTIQWMERSLEIFLSYRHEVFPNGTGYAYLNIHSAQTGVIINSLEVIKEDNPKNSVCQSLFVPSTSVFEGGYVCFMHDENLPGASGKLRITTPASAQESYECRDLNFIKKLHLPFLDRNFQWDQWTAPLGEYGNDPRSYGSGYCFWKGLENTVGSEHVTRAIQKLETPSKDEETVNVLKNLGGSTIESIPFLERQLADKFGMSKVAIRELLQAKNPAFCPKK